MLSHPRDVLGQDRGFFQTFTGGPSMDYAYLRATSASPNDTGTPIMCKCSFSSGLILASRLPLDPSLFNGDLDTWDTPKILTII